MNKRLNKFSPEVRERAVRLVHEHRGEYPSLWAAIESIAPKIGCVPQTLSDWVKRYERQQIAPRHDLVHSFEQDLLARAPGTEIESELCLFHAVTAGNLRASIEVAGVGF